MDVGARSIDTDGGQCRRRLLIVSNRLPFRVVEQHGTFRLRPSSGGLATALRGIHARSNSLWVGSAAAGHFAPGAGRMNDRLAAARLASISLSELEASGFYRRYSNGILWPTLHGMASLSASDREGWGMYRSVNARFADAVAASWRSGDDIWVHDYQLLLLPSMLRERLPTARIGFFLHTPVPSPATLDALAEWPELANGMLGADVIGFQTRRDAGHFAAAIADERCAAGDPAYLRSLDGRLVRVIACPIGIDHGAFAERSHHPSVLKHLSMLREGSTGPVFVGIDRLDYTKGIPERLLAFEGLLTLDPGLRRRARFIQVAVPSRAGVSGYDALRRRVEEIVGRINTVWGTADWTPVKYVYGSVDANMLVALYRAADVMVVTPRCDGMNLVAKEFVASRTDGDGALVLSRTAGAARELRAAVLVDPVDVGSIVAGYRRALLMPVTERRSRMLTLRDAVRSCDVFGWADRFLETLSRTCATAALDG